MQLVAEARRQLTRRRNARGWRAYGQVGAGANVDFARVSAAEPPAGATPPVTIGPDCLLSSSFVLERASARIDVGARTYMGADTLIDAAEQITIGDDILISFGVIIFDHDSHSLDWRQRLPDVGMWARGEKDWTHVRRAPVVIESHAWIGARAVICKGVTIGRGSVVGTGSIVTSDVPPGTVVAGNPARVIRELDTPP